VLRASFGPAQQDCPMGELGEGESPASTSMGPSSARTAASFPSLRAGRSLRAESGEVHGFRHLLPQLRGDRADRRGEEVEIPVPRHRRKDPRIRRIFDLIEMVKDSDSTVLIHRGERDRERAVRTRHPRAVAPQRETVRQGERGGPHGNPPGIRAVRPREGCLHGRRGRQDGAVRGGRRRTIFLDEIGEISPALQVKLLHVLQDHEFERVGSSRTQRGGRPRDRRHEQGAEGRDARRAVPGRSLLPVERHPPHRPAVARAPGGHPPAGRSRPEVSSEAWARPGARSLPRGRCAA